MRKLRHQEGQKFMRQKYITEYGAAEISEMIKTKLEMWDLRRNMEKGRKCMCNEEEETIEHILACGAVGKKIEKDVSNNWNCGKDIRKITEFIKECIEYREKEK